MVYMSWKNMTLPTYLLMSLMALFFVVSCTSLCDALGIGNAMTRNKKEILIEEEWEQEKSEEKDVTVLAGVEKGENAIRSRKIDRQQLQEFQRKILKNPSEIKLLAKTE